jgi:DNA polymerase V
LYLLICYSCADSYYCQKTFFMMRVVDIYRFSDGLYDNKLPLFYYPVEAGFPSPADDGIEKSLHLAELAVKNPDFTFFVRVSGQSMNRAGILDGDILVVDKTILPEDGRIVVVYLNGENTVKRIRYKGKKVYLMPESENPLYQPIVVDPFLETLEIFGVVIGLHRNF